MGKLASTYETPRGAPAERLSCVNTVRRTQRLPYQSPLLRCSGGANTPPARPPARPPAAKMRLATLAGCHYPLQMRSPPHCGRKRASVGVYRSGQRKARRPTFRSGAGFLAGAGPSTALVNGTPSPTSLHRGIVRTRHEARNMYHNGIKMPIGSTDSQIVVCPSKAGAASARACATQCVERREFRG